MRYLLSWVPCILRSPWVMICKNHHVLVAQEHKCEPPQQLSFHHTYFRPRQKKTGDHGITLGNATENDPKKSFIISVWSINLNHRIWEVESNMVHKMPSGLDDHHIVDGSEIRRSPVDMVNLPWFMVRVLYIPSKRWVFFAGFPVAINYVGSQGRSER